MQRMVEVKKLSEEILATGSNGHFQTGCRI